MNPSGRDTMRRDGALFLLSAASGGMDVMGFLAMGVFLSAMTGNTALMGIALGQDRLTDAVRSVLAFAGFAAGVAIASAGGKMKPKYVLAMEAVLLAAFAALWPRQVTMIASPMALSPNSLPVLTLIGGAAMGIQSHVARRLNAPGINTVVFTSTITAIVGALAAAVVGHKPRTIEAKTWRQIFAFLSYLAGAVGLGALMSYHLPIAPIPAFAAALLAALLA